MNGQSYETWLLVIIAAISAWFMNTQRPNMVLVAKSNEQVDSVMINMGLWKSKYYCPKTCKVNHAHLAHAMDWSCGDTCEHWTFDNKDIIMK